MKVETAHRRIRDDFVLEQGNLYQRLYQMESHSAAQGIPLVWDKAIDFSVFDDRGNQWIDMTSGIFVANAGHANPFIKAAIKKQLDADLLFSYNYPTAIRQKFLAKLLSISPPHLNKVALVNSGSEALDNAYRLIKLWGKKNNRRHIITLRGSYHGRGLSNDLICGHEHKAEWSNVVDPDVLFMDFPYRETDRFRLDLLPPANKIAAFLLETFQGWGAWFYPRSFIEELCKFAKNAGALICFDEMQSGFYRLGPLYGYMTYGNLEPDILCLGKGISSSLPLSAVLSREEIIDQEAQYGNEELHGTHSGNPLCCAAGLANLEFLSNPEQIEKRKKTMQVFEEEARSLESLPLVKQVNTRGMIAGIICDDAKITTKIVMGCIHQGVLPVCTFKHSIKLAPPLTITTAAIREAFEVIRQCIKEVARAT